MAGGKRRGSSRPQARRALCWELQSSAALNPRRHSTAQHGIAQHSAAQRSRTSSEEEEERASGMRPADPPGGRLRRCRRRCCRCAAAAAAACPLPFVRPALLAPHRPANRPNGPLPGGLVEHKHQFCLLPACDPPLGQAYGPAHHPPRLRAASGKGARGAGWRWELVGCGVRVPVGSGDTKDEVGLGALRFPGAAVLRCGGSTAAARPSSALPRQPSRAGGAARNAPGVAALSLPPHKKQPLSPLPHTPSPPGSPPAAAPHPVGRPAPNALLRPVIIHVSACPALTSSCCTTSLSCRPPSHS